MVLGPLPGELVVLIDEGARRIDQCLRAYRELGAVDRIANLDRPYSALSPATQRLDVIRGDAAIAQGGPDEVEDEARIVIVQVRVRVLESTDAVVGVDHGFLVADPVPRKKPGDP